MRNILVTAVITFSALALAQSQTQAIEKMAAAASKPASTADFYGIGFALSNVSNIMMTDKLEIALNPVVWNLPVRSDGFDKYASVNSDQFLEFSKRDSKFDIITVNKRSERATATVFENNRPASHTVVTSFGEYTATPFFCELLKEQTGSKSFKDLAEKAVTCNDFYTRTKINDATQALLQTHLKTHAANMELLKNSAAKSMIKSDPEIVGLAKTLGVEKGSGTHALLQSFGLQPGQNKQPRSLLNRTASTADIEDRQMIRDIGEACGRLWADGRGWKSGGPATTAKPVAK